MHIINGCSDSALICIEWSGKSFLSKVIYHPNHIIFENAREISVITWDNRYKSGLFQVNKNVTLSLRLVSLKLRSKERKKSKMQKSRDKNILRGRTVSEVG